MIMKKQQEEEFRDVPGYECYYECSDQGRVRSLDRTVIDSRGQVRKLKGRMMKPSLNGKGYLQVSLNKKGKHNVYGLHVLLAMTFLGHIPDGHETVVNHKDHTPLNNCLSNLELKSQRENLSIDKWRYNHSSKYVGVCRNKTRQKWQSNIWIGDKHIYLGLFIDEDEAAQAYKIALKFLDKFDGDGTAFRTFVKSKIKFKQCK